MHSVDEPCIQCRKWLTEAVELYKGDFLSGFSLADTYLFDNWQFEQAERLRRLLSNALETLTNEYGRASNFEAAMTYAQRWLAVDLLHEPAHRQLMLLYASAGKRSAALRQYRECVRILEQELGVSPLEETASLYKAIQENHILVHPVKSVTQFKMKLIHPNRLYRSPPSRHGLPLVGRAREWENLLNMHIIDT